MKISTASQSRTLRIRGTQGDSLPQALTTALEGARVAAGWIRAVGVLDQVVLRATAEDGSFVETRYPEPLQLVMLEGTASANAAETSLSAVFARQTTGGTETIAGAFVSANVLSLDAMLVELESSASANTQPSRERAAPAVQPAWEDAISASKDRGAPAKSTTLASATLPQRPVKPVITEVDQPLPEAGDIVEHFAFGTCEVVKSDGDRIFLRVEKDQRVKEIALAMLRVVPIDLSSAPKLFRLERKL